jgi:hypothetical protein
MTDVNAELESARDPLIAKVAFLQEQQTTWEVCCEEAERVAAEVQHLLFPGFYTTTLSRPLDRTTRL